MNRISLAPGVYYVGAVDWNLRDFHGYTTPRGVTYNSYLIVDEKICLVDTVKEAYAGEMLARISDIIDPAQIDYVVVNHVEPDHSGALGALMAKAPQATVVLTAQGKNELIKHYGQSYNFQIVQEGDVIDLGQNKLQFIPMAMLHWPDSMACYLDGLHILFSNDAFGQHICTSKRFDDENDQHEVMLEAAKYYANILMPYTKLVGKAVQRLKDFSIDLIAPSHGVIWRSHIEDIMAKYEQWGQGYTENKVLILYDTMWGSTEKMAKQLLDGLAAAGINVKLYKMSTAERSDVLLDMLEAKGILVGSSSLNNSVLPSVGAMLFYLKGLKPAGKRLASVFGAFGWNGGAKEDMEDLLRKAGFDLGDGLFVKWAADPVELKACFEFGQLFGQKILELE